MGIYSFIKRKFSNKYITVDDARRMGVKVGKNCRLIHMSNYGFSSEPYLVELGDHVSITSATFVTHDGGVWIFREENPQIELFGKIRIGNNVFIGMNAIILPNTIVGNNCIIAAGAVVKGVHESNSVIGGVPAKKICSIENYFEKNSDKFTYIKNMQEDQKREILLKRYE